jgi:hypothetical protein
LEGAGACAGDGRSSKWEVLWLAQGLAQAMESGRFRCIKFLRACEERVAGLCDCTICVLRSAIGRKRRRVGWRAVARCAGLARRRRCPCLACGVVAHIANHLQAGMFSALPRVILRVVELLAIVGKRPGPSQKCHSPPTGPEQKILGYLTEALAPGRHRKYPESFAEQAVAGQDKLASLERSQSVFIVMVPVSFLRIVTASPIQMRCLNTRSK